ncbi:MAG: GGDEF domain-containing protein [Gammaproteobacteria bacterium]|nr:GGDEF domain-containing protein [Gammaproteobacteria bacterium]
MTPANYAVWYEYVSGNNIALNDAVDVHLEDSGALSDEESRDLYTRFFDREKDQAALLELRQDLKRILAEVLGFVGTGATASKKSSEKLLSVIDKLKPDMTRDEIHAVTEEVLFEARTAMSSSEILSERLNATMAEMQDMKKDLDDAKREAKTDTLTKLANRKAFDSILEKATKDADSSGIEVSMIFADLDLFKKINDTHGHLVGDQVLKVVAKSLKGAVKGRDLVARYGGEEFAIILLNTSIDNAKKLAENIRSEIAAKRIQRRDNRKSLGNITMSFGVARYFPSEGSESFLQRVDRALYMSKRKGRNTVSEAPPPVI